MGFDSTQPLATFDPVAAPSAAASLATRDEAGDAGVAQDLAQAEHVIAAPDDRAESASDANDADHSAGERRCVHPPPFKVLTMLHDPPQCATASMC
jgi:hypothetical protein